MNNFWQGLKKPFFVLAPMDDVTDTTFRQVVSMCGKPDIFFTEFINADGFVSGKGDLIWAQKLKFISEERPLVVQIWGCNPDKFFQASQKIKEMGFDGIDINMGCPDKKVLKSGGGGALINSPELAKEIIMATKEGAGGLPVSVKTRVGFKNIQTEEWLGFLLKFNLTALSVHSRTVVELSKVPARWEEIAKVVQIRDMLGSQTLIIGNGDIKSYQEGLEKAKEYGADGIMIGRGVFENPWIFNPHIDFGKINIWDRVALLQKHIDLFVSTYQDKKSFLVLRKYFKIYASGFKGAKELRIKLTQTTTPQEVKELLNLLKDQLKHKVDQV